MGKTDDSRENGTDFADINGAVNGPEGNAELLMNIITELMKRSDTDPERGGINVQIKCPHCGNEVTLQITVKS